MKLSPRPYKVSLGLLCWLAFIVRFYLLEDISLHEDEVTSQILYVQRPLFYIFTDYHPNNHWLASFLGHVLGQLGPQRFLVRWPSVLFGTVTIPLLAVTAHRLLGSRRAGLIAAGLLCFSAFHWQWSQLFRGYSALVFFTLCSFLLWQQALKTKQPRYWLGLFVALSCAIASHLYGVLWLVTLVTILLGQSFGSTEAEPPQRKWLVALALGGLVVTSFFIWFSKTHVIDLYHTTPAGSIGEHIFYQWLALGPTLPKVYSFLSHLAIAFTAQPQPSLALVLFWGLSLPGLLFLYRSKPQVAYLLGLWVMLPLVLIIIAEFAIAGFFVSERFLLFTLPAWLMLVTHSLITVSEWGVAPGQLNQSYRQAIGGLFLLITLGYLGTLNLNLAHISLRQRAGYQWREMAVQLAQAIAPTDLVICHRLPHQWIATPTPLPDECITELGHRLAALTAGPMLPIERLENIVTLETGLQFRGRASQPGVVWAVVWGEESPLLDQKAGASSDYNREVSLLAFKHQASMAANLEQAIAAIAQRDTLSPDRFTYDLYRAKLAAYQGDHPKAEGLLIEAAAWPHPPVALAEARDTLHILAHFSKPGLTPAQPVEVNFGGPPPLIRLGGYTRLGSAQAGQKLSLTLFWESLAATSTNYIIFLHWRDERGQTISQLDVQPFTGMYPTSRWIPGTKIEETLVWTLPSDFSSGWYSLYLGLYQVDTLTRLSIIADQTGENAAFLERLWVEPLPPHPASIRPRSAH